MKGADKSSDTTPNSVKTTAPSTGCRAGTSNVALLSAWVSSGGGPAQAPPTRLAASRLAAAARPATPSGGIAALRQSWSRVLGGRRGERTPGKGAGRARVPGALRQEREAESEAGGRLRRPAHPSGPRSILVTSSSLPGPLQAGWQRARDSGLDPGIT